MVLSGIKLFYPSAREWMWDYCTYLGPFTDKKGDNYDLGVMLDDGRLVGAIVYGDVPGNYMSPDLSGRHDIKREVYHETIRRAEELKLV